jgi:hypothetical protein
MTSVISIGWSRDAFEHALKPGVRALGVSLHLLLLAKNTLLFYNALGRSDLLGITACFDTRHNIESRREAATSLAFSNSNAYNLYS